MSLRRPNASQDVLEMVADAVPDGGRVQLLRSRRDPALKQGGNTHQGCPRLVKFGMHAGQRNGRLAGMLSPASHRGH